ncbi:hypothetical protein [Caballeronia sp. PC1]|uniref:hypothetical protein n=1 Tax=Caballeronia sp. PC1 TaxID=2906765 RepID=UPI001F2E51B1|nr:hypothetical protein [Caballeronia sp. PC1]MCE4544724.1 hypothetical protein [Caballeronia sp. PC1]
MIAVQHFGSISGGKDSQAVLCKMVERIERKGLAAFGNNAPRFLCADNGHENPITLDHIAYLDEAAAAHRPAHRDRVGQRCARPHRRGGLRP